MSMAIILGALLLAQESAPSITDLVSRLTSGKHEERDRARAMLIGRGPDALIAVKPLRASRDPNLAFLAKSIVGHIDWDPYLPPRARRSWEVSYESLGSNDPREVHAALIRMGVGNTTRPCSDHGGSGYGPGKRKTSPG